MAERKASRGIAFGGDDVTDIPRSALRLGIALRRTNIRARRQLSARSLRSARCAKLRMILKAQGRWDKLLKRYTTKTRGARIKSSSLIKKGRVFIFHLTPYLIGNQMAGHGIKFLCDDTSDSARLLSSPRADGSPYRRRDGRLRTHAARKILRAIPSTSGCRQSASNWPRIRVFDEKKPVFFYTAFVIC